MVEARAEVPRGWDLLIALGMGHSIAEVANANGIKPGTIKARVSRARARLRMLHGPRRGITVRRREAGGPNS